MREPCSIATGYATAQWIVREGAAKGLDASRMAVAGEFAEGYYLSRRSMEWFWDLYIPDLAQRAEITASPNQAPLEQLTGLPPTLPVRRRGGRPSRRGRVLYRQAARGRLHGDTATL